MHARLSEFADSEGNFLKEIELEEKSVISRLATVLRSIDPWKGKRLGN